MAVRFYVAHGASGSSASMRGHVEGLRKRGVDAVAIDLPVKKAEDVVGKYRTIVPDRSGGRRPGDHRRRPVVRRPGLDARRGRARDGLRRHRLLQLPAPPARQARPGAGPDEPLAGDPLPGPAAVGRGRPVRPDRAAAGPPCRSSATPSCTRIRTLGHSLKPVLDDALDRAAAFLQRVGGNPSVVPAASVRLDKATILTRPQAPRRHGRLVAR